MPPVEREPGVTERSGELVELGKSDTEMTQKQKRHRNRVKSDTETGAALKREEQARAAEDQVIRHKLETTETGGIHVTAMGALWLFVGVTLSTASPEIAKWLQ
jgi:hypothetical protein